MSDAATITTGIDARQLEQLARQVVPDDPGLPAAEGRMLSDGLERLQASRPDLYEQLILALPLAAEEADDIGRLRSTNEAAYQALSLAIASIYLTDPSVQKALEYPGHRPVDVGDPYARLATYSELTAPVAARGFIWKCTPSNTDTTKE